MILLAARAVTGAAFLILGFRNISNHPILAELMRARGLPLPAISATAGIAMQIGFGGLLIVGIMPAVSALGLAGFVLMATTIAHWPFDKTGAERQENITACLGNAIMLGGLLAQAAIKL
jgi:putative oxidoreductase